MHYRYILAFSEQETTLDDALKFYNLHGYGFGDVTFHDYHEVVISNWAKIQSGEIKTEQTFKTIDEYAEFLGHIRNEDGRYGDLFNWDGLYDYYKIGGFYNGWINGKNIVTYNEFVEWIQSPSFSGIDGFVLGSIEEEERYDTLLDSEDIEVCRQSLLEMVDNLYDKPEYWKFAVIDMHR